MLEKTTKERIVDAAIELFAQKGYTETSLKEIAQKCDIQAASIYNHFESKNDILELILEDYVGFTRENVMDDEVVALRAKTEDPKALMMSMFYRYGAKDVGRYTDILKIILHEHLRNDAIGDFYAKHFIRESEDRLDFLLIQLIENKRIAPVNHRYYAKIMNNLVLSMSLEYSHRAKNDAYAGAERITMDELINFLIDIILADDGLKPGDAERNRERWIKYASRAEG